MSSLFMGAYRLGQLRKKDKEEQQQQKQKRLVLFFKNHNILSEFTFFSQRILIEFQLN